MYCMEGTEPYYISSKIKKKTKNPDVNNAAFSIKKNIFSTWCHIF